MWIHTPSIYVYHLVENPPDSPLPDVTSELRLWELFSREELIGYAGYGGTNPDGRPSLTAVPCGLRENGEHRCDTAASCPAAILYVMYGQVYFDLSSRRGLGTNELS